MSAFSSPEIADTLWHFWFEQHDRAAWFAKDPAFDAALGEFFGHLPDLAAKGALDDWANGPRTCLSLVLVLDQLPRNLYRGDAKSYAFDEKGLSVAARAIDQGFDHQVTVRERLFFYLPYEHSENIDDQHRAIALIKAMGDERGVEYAIRHKDVIERFGRFPHRNEVLGRVSTEEELAFLEQPGSRF